MTKVAPREYLNYDGHEGRLPDMDTTIWKEEKPEFAYTYFAEGWVYLLIHEGWRKSFLRIWPPGFSTFTDVILGEYLTVEEAKDHAVPHIERIQTKQDGAGRDFCAKDTEYWWSTRICD